MAKNKNKIQFLLNEYLEVNGSISIILPDGVKLQIGITQEGSKGQEISGDYCWVSASRDERATMMDRYAMSLYFDEDTNHQVIQQKNEGVVTVI